MPWISVRRLAGFVAVVGVATLAALTAHAWDNNKRLPWYTICEEVNLDNPGIEVPWSSCREGWTCVACLGEPNPVGHYVANGGTGNKMWHPYSVTCSGDKVKSVCVWTEHGINCDISQYWIDGQCGGALERLDFQPQGPPPGG